MYSILNWKTAHTISIGMFWSGLGGVKKGIMAKTLLPDLQSLLFLVKTSSAKDLCLQLLCYLFLHDISEQLPVPLHHLGISWM